MIQVQVNLEIYVGTVERLAFIFFISIGLFCTHTDSKFEKLTFLFICSGDETKTPSNTSSQSAATCVEITKPEVSNHFAFST